MVDVGRNIDVNISNNGNVDVGHNSNNACTAQNVSMNMEYSLGERV